MLAVVLTRKIAAVALVALVSCGATGPGDSDAGGTCPRDLPASCPADAPTYDGGIAPIVEANCLPCHGPSGISADVPLGTYSQLYARRTDVLSQVYNCRMPQPPQPPLSAADRAALLAWLVCGAPND